MSEEILVNVSTMETRVALVDNGTVQDIYIERATSASIVGNIYAGKVVRVLPGMQAAFVDIGTDRNSFIHVSDFTGERGNGRAQHRADISEHVHEGKKLIVQVTRDPLGGKGARVSTRLSVSSPYLVLMPGTDHVGVSQQIDDPAERERLLQLLANGVAREGMAQMGGFIIRTAAEHLDMEDIRADLRCLKRLWAAVSSRAGLAGKTQLLYEDLPLYLRTVRDLARSSVERIRIDSREGYAAMQAYCADYVPRVCSLLEHYSSERPLFDLHGIEQQIQHALSRTVKLGSGGYLSIDQTEAMTTIDVNTGSFVGRSNQEETVFKTNLEAATALARQLRLRNLGGIIIVDFIDMQNPEHRRQVHRSLEQAMQRDPARSTISSISELGLVQMTRRRTRDSLERILCEACPVCQGRGVLKTAESVCREVFRQILREAPARENGTLMVLAAQSVVDRLLHEESPNVADLQDFIGKTISLRVEPNYTQEHFDIVLL